MVEALIFWGVSLVLFILLAPIIHHTVTTYWDWLDKILNERRKR